MIPDLLNLGYDHVIIPRDTGSKAHRRRSLSARRRRIAGRSNCLNNCWNSALVSSSARSEFPPANEDDAVVIKRDCNRFHSDCRRDRVVGEVRPIIRSI